MHMMEMTMAFIQLIEYTTSRIDEANRLFDQWLTETQGKRTTHRIVLTSDRDRPNTYIEIVEFPSYEEACETLSCRRLRLSVLRLSLSAMRSLYFVTWT